MLYKILAAATLTATATMALATETPVDNLGLQSPKAAAELYQLHHGDGVGQLALPVAVTRDPTNNNRCLYRAPYKNEAGANVLYVVTWQGNAVGSTECPR